MEKEKINDKITKFCNSAMDSSVENSMYINRVWVQCENESCLKWRLLLSEDAAKVDHSKPWYCFMNADSRYNQCSISEEDFPEETQLHQSGFKIVYSQLPLGSLVLVKLQNWPSQENVQIKRSGIKVHFKKHIYSMDILMSKDWKCAAYQSRINPKQMPKFLWWPRKGLLRNNYPDQRDLYPPCSSMNLYSLWGLQEVDVKCLMQVSKTNIEKKKPKLRKRKRKAILKCSFENVCSDDALSKESMVVSETEVLLKELEQMLQQALEPTAIPDESEEECGEEINAREKLSKGIPEAPAGSPFQNQHEEDYLVIDGMKLRAGECIENITNKFKEIDALMSEF
ncbi:zinc finger CW-type PWWP domain protein 2 isoform X3 [Ictidomys tridecemlineatus]|uniref:zinc finger CW-type PWWP domain protein 2 isoform X3 n=1 Tax=Ictidomys tridecemlineatus TaxID=43179 RepID=UPI001A9E5ADB|nr:zinc finger CW-type PWWP domain protein 2 isoform X3 [Ictidomys tridecemlineatus]